MATAHDRAADATGKTTMIPSPRVLTSLPPEAATAWRSAEKCARRNSPAASVLRAEASAVESTRSVKSTAMFSLAATRPPPSPLGEILGATRDSPRAAAVPVRPDGPGPIPPTAV